MSHSGSTISAPVQILSDLCPVLGTSRTGLGNIITNADINRWAKFKPVRSSKLSALTTSDRAAVDWGYEILMRQGSNITGLIDLAKAAGMPDGNWGETGCAWAYQKPRGASYSEYFRLLDFNGYVHTDKFSLSELSLRLEGAQSYAIDKYGRHIRHWTVPPYRQDQLKKSDFTALASLSYLGIVYRRASLHSDWDCRSFSSLPYTFQPTLTRGETYEAAFFICNKALSNKGSIAASDRFYLLPYPYLTLLTSTNFGLGFTSPGTAVIGTGTVSFQLSYTCFTSDENRHITNVQLCHRKAGNYQEAEYGTYTITQTASPVAADNEADSAIIKDYSGSSEIVLPPASIAIPFPYSSEGLQRIFSLPVNPYSGATFLRFTHMHYVDGQGWIEDVGGTYSIRVSLRLPTP